MSEHTIRLPAKLGGQSSQRERRAAVRYQSTKKVSFFAQPKTEDMLWARVRNISTGGIGLILSRTMRPDTLLTIELKSTPESAPLTLSAAVMHCTPDACGTYLVGCQFDTPLSKEQLQAFL